ncbi:MAG: hypothetical protein IJ062_07080 [Firmicutes bacterium]|nr:hypothetical protein [Bacillota bacterium]
MKEDLKNFVGAVVAIVCALLLALAVSELPVMVVLLFTVALPVALSVINLTNFVFKKRRHEKLLMFGVLLGAGFYWILTERGLREYLESIAASLRVLPIYLLIALWVSFAMFFISLVILGFYAYRVKRPVLILARVIAVMANIVNLYCAFYSLKITIPHFDITDFLPLMYNFDILLLSVRYLKGWKKETENG